MNKLYADRSNKTYDELCNMRIGDMNEDELYDFAQGLLDEVWNFEKIINKAIEYIWSTKYEWGDLEEDNEDFDIDAYKLLDILKGGNNE